MKYTDPDGNYLEVSDNGDGTFIIIGGEVNSDKNIYIMNDGVFSGILGQMMTENSFFDEGLLVKGAIIDCNDTSGADFINNFEENTPDIFSYIDNARNGKAYDFKDLGKSNLKGIDVNKYRHRGMPLGNNIFGSARDVGNYAAGYVAGKSGLFWGEARLGFDAYQSFKSRRITTEGAATQAAQRIGFSAGSNSPEGKAVIEYRSKRLQMLLTRW